MIKATIVADSINIFGDRVTTMEVVGPRIILAEFNTHRIFSRNSASSRAIPTRKLIKSIMENPFVPIAWQKEHAGMQGKEYYDKDQLFSLTELRDIIFGRLMKVYNTSDVEDSDVVNMFSRIMEEFNNGDNVFLSYTLDQFWLMIRDKVVTCVMLLYCLGATKQIANRLLEPFMWHTILVTSTEWSNFFNLRCPKYIVHQDDKEVYFKTKKHLLASISDFPRIKKRVMVRETIDWLKEDAGGAEIHIKAVAEAMLDALEASTPELLQSGDWHIPYKDKIFANLWFDRSLAMKDIYPQMIKISTAMAARTSYTVVGDETEVSFDRLIKIHDDMVVADPLHASPMEHCNRSMSEDEYEDNIRTDIIDSEFTNEEKTVLIQHTKKGLGWCRNIKGFIQYRHLLENGMRL